MSKQYYLCVDGGGTKLLSVLFDNSFHFISTAKGGSINPNFASIEDIGCNMEQNIDLCLQGTKVQSLDAVYITMPGPADLYASILQKRLAVKDVRIFGEGHACLYAGLMKTTGIVALSGTGSGLFYLREGRLCAHMGGWGALIGDDASGYDIGNRAIRSVIRYIEHRGPKTALFDHMMDFYELEKPFDITGKIYRAKSYRTAIAAFALETVKAAEYGDAVARSLLVDVGQEMADGVCVLIERFVTLPTNTDVLVSGSIWRNNPYMYHAFCEKMVEKYAEIVIKKPIFDPVLGGLFDIAFRHGIKPDAAFISNIKREFKSFIYEKE